MQILKFFWKNFNESQVIVDSSLFNLKLTKIDFSKKKQKNELSTSKKENQSLMQLENYVYF